MKNYFSILVSLVAMDMVWLGLVAKNFYQKKLGYIFAEKFSLWPAIIFYVIYAFGIMFFVVTPALAAKSWTVAFGRGALLGLLAYATYDLTNQATIAKWPLVITAMDLFWGVFVTTAVSVAVYFFLSKV